MSLLLFGALMLAGGVGAGLRFALDRAITGGRSEGFPLGILVVNASGSLLLGLVTGLSADLMPAEWAAVLGTGLLGGYTTFSTVSVESVLLAERGRGWAALGNAVGTVLICVAAAGLGLWVGGRF